MFSDKTIRRFIEWAQPSLQQMKIVSLNIELRRLIEDIVSIDLPYQFNKKFFNIIELAEKEDIEMLFHITFEDGISFCSVDTVFTKNKYETKQKHPILGDFRARKFSLSYTEPVDKKEITEWVKKTEDTVKKIIALLNDYVVK